MRIIDFLHIIEHSAQRYRPLSMASIKRNTHLHECDPKQVIDQDVIDAVLTDFINFLAGEQGVDYGIKASDIYWPESRDELRRIDALRRTNLVQAEHEMDKWENDRESKRKGTE